MFGLDFLFCGLGFDGGVGGGKERERESWGQETDEAWRNMRQMNKYKREMRYRGME